MCCHEGTLFRILKCMLKMADKVDGFDYDKFFRANVSVSQYDEFIETYGIKEGDGMYVATDDRIAVW